MATHLSLTASNAAGAVKRSISTPSAAETGANLLDSFADLLKRSKDATAQIDRSSSSRVDARAAAADVSLESRRDERKDEPEAVAAVVDAQIPIQNQQDAKAKFKDLVEGLADLKEKLDAGETLDADQLKKLEAGLADLAASLNVNLDDLPSLDDLQAMLTATLPEDTSLTADLTRALAPLAETMLNGNATPEGTTPDQAALVQSIGDKLAALLKSLNADAIDADQLAAMGLDADATLDADIEAALAKLTAAIPTVDASPNAQVLGDASLDVTDTDLLATGEAKPAEADAKVETETDLAVTAKPDTDGDSGKDGDAQSDDKGKEIKISLAADANAKTTDPTFAAQAAVPAARADAIAPRVVVQAGYQTSQQQLNLPQLAFEMARQAGDGNTRFQIRLDPAELGRIDVRLDIDASGQVNAKLTVEKAETLDLMQRDQRALEKALQQAGLDGSKTNLEFSLKQNFSNGQGGQDGDARQALFGASAPVVEETPLPTVNLYRGSLTASGVNILA